MNLPEGLPAWAYIVVSALVLAAQIVTAIWINHRGDERDRATRGEITNNHEMPLRDDLDDKALRTLDAIESLRGAVDGLRDDMNGEFKTVNERVSNAEREHLQLREDIRELRRHR